MNARRSVHGRGTKRRSFRTQNFARGGGNETAFVPYSEARAWRGERNGVRSIQSRRCGASIENRKSKIENFSPHIPVLLDEVLNGLALKGGGKYIDGTVGAGGHAEAILKATAPDGKLLGLDGDPEALEIARKTLAPFGERAILIHSNFTEIKKIASAHGFLAAQGVLLDLGLSSMQLANVERGFSFLSTSLDMRMDQRTNLTALEIVNTWDETELADLIFEYGEERASRKIARWIVANRPLENAQHLASVIERAVGRHGKIHPATKTFQALRIVVNDELENLNLVLPQLSEVVAPGGRAAILTFHSLEDRSVKNFFKAHAQWRNLTKHPIQTTYQQARENPRARSAKLRVAERV